MRVMPSVAPHESNTLLRYDSITPNTGNLKNLPDSARVKTYEVFSEKYYEYRSF
jgi:hypothetical protein